MSRLKKFLPVLFGRHVARQDEARQGAQDHAPAIPVFEFRDGQQAAIFCNVLTLQVPSENLAAMAFDDYYPAFYFALKRYEDAKRADVAPENAPRVRPGNFDHLPMVSDANTSSVLEEFEALKAELNACLDMDESGHCTRFDREGYMQAVYNHLDILVAMRNAMNAPIQDIKEIRSTALAAQDKPLKADCVTDRYGRAYSEECLDAFLDFITWAETHAPTVDRHRTVENSAPETPSLSG